MRKLVIAFLATVFSVLPQISFSATPTASPASPPGDLVTLAANTTKSVVTVLCANSIGSGWSASINLSSTEIQNGNKSFVVTNHHVISGCTFNRQVTLILSDQSRVTGTVYSWDEANDLASIFTSTDIPKLMWEGSTPQQGWWVGVLGSPLGFPGILTTGIVSSVNKSTFKGTTNAAINPGNSGGPVFDRTGRVIGLATAKYINAEGFGIFHGTPLLCVKILSCGNPSGVWSGLTPEVPKPVITPTAAPTPTPTVSPTQSPTPSPTQDSTNGIQAKVQHASKGWSAWISSYDYVKGPNPLVENKVTTVVMKGVCTSKGKTIQAMKNTGTNGVKYPNGMRYVTPKWKCVNGTFTGKIDVSGNTRMDISEEPTNRVGTHITFRRGLEITFTELGEPTVPEPYVEPPAISDPSVTPPRINSLKFMQGGNPPTVYKLATIELAGSCSSSGNKLELYWNLVSENSSPWTLVKKDIPCSSQQFTVRAAAFPGLQYKMREFPSKNFSDPRVLPKGILK
jgi:hypothetical protein